MITTQETGGLSTHLSALRPPQPSGPHPDVDRDPVPVLALYGGRDPIMLLAENRARLEEGLREGRCPDYTVVVFPTAEHLMVETSTGAGKEFPYATQFVTGCPRPRHGGSPAIVIPS